MSTHRIIKGWVNADQARRSGDGYDLGLVRMSVYGPDEEHTGDKTYSYDQPATLIINPSTTAYEMGELRKALEGMVRCTTPEFAERNGFGPQREAAASILDKYPRT